MIIIPMTVFSQKYDGICNEVSKLGIQIDNLSFTIYPDNFFIKDRYENITQAKNETPEDLVKSQFSVKDNDWLSYNYNRKMVWSDDKFKKIIDPSNYVELLCKLGFKIMNDEYVILKINLRTNSANPLSICITMKKGINKWHIAENKMLMDLEFIFMFLSTHDLYYIFNNKVNSESPKVNEIIKSLYIDNNLRFNDMIQKTGKILLNSEYQEKPSFRDIKLTKAIENKVLTNDKLLYSKQKYCNYFENNISEFSDRKLELVISFLRQEKGNVFPLNSINYIDYLENDIFILKYKVKIDDIEEIKNEYFKIYDTKCEKISSELVDLGVQKIFLKDSNYLNKYFEN